MRYLAIQLPAAEEIASNRLMQSADFEIGKALADAISDRDTVIEILAPRLTFQRTESGLVITFVGSTSPQFIVTDLEEVRLFKGQSPDDALHCLQKIARFAIKYWEKRVLSPSEIIYPAFRRAVIFPFPISQKTGFRICIDLDPDGDRLNKRNQAGRYLLVYKAGTEEGQGPKEAPTLSVFRKFLDEIPKVDLNRKGAARETIDISAFQNVSVTPIGSGRLDIHQGFEAWMRVLTAEQRRFVELPVNSPIRIEGPAGTGKTLCLALKAVYELRAAQKTNEENVTLFVTHSEASKKSILTVLQSMGADDFLNGNSLRQVLRVHTLQGLCAEILKQELSVTELLDPDAYDAKQLQLMYIEEAFTKVQSELLTYTKFMSPEFAAYIAEDGDGALLQMLQHEIGVVIKGRANEQFDLYKRIPALKVGLPIKSEGDKSFVWRIYELYREQLISSAQFDTDDVMLSALGTLTTPIWRRRRVREGYDTIFIDETHLFNMNELSVFHHLTKKDDSFHIVFAVDRSQAIGDRGWGDDSEIDTLLPEQEGRQRQSKVRVSKIFRSSPDIVNLAFSVTSSGASLFTNFEDPLSLAESNLTLEEERMCEPPKYVPYNDDASLVSGAFEQAEALVREMPTSRGNVAIIAFSNEIFHDLCRKAEFDNKPVELLKERGNLETVKKAQQSGRFILTLPDYVGGLEFDAVVLVGVDEGRVPPSIHASAETKAFLSFSAHNRLYVAITRARYRVVIIGVRARGPSSVLRAAFNNNALHEVELH